MGCLELRSALTPVRLSSVGMGRFVMVEINYSVSSTCQKFSFGRSTVNEDNYCLSCMLLFNEQ